MEKAEISKITKTNPNLELKRQTKDECIYKPAKSNPEIAEQSSIGEL